MTHDWFCPQCGRPLKEMRVTDNATGRSGVVIGCRIPTHFQSPRRDTVQEAERGLDQLISRHQ